ncbi:MAG: SCP2 sterol-binding domain-containing protein [Woeseiaceae bacterium]|nr:SCP2 sterol-binding domain-containing protein [Woeseiaceae bacterium]
MDPLETLLRPLASAINRNIAEVTRARELCAELDGTTVAVRVRDSSLAMTIAVGEDGIALSRKFDREPDVVITGSLLTLARLASSDGQPAVGSRQLDLSGDIDKAQAFQKLLACARPDIEEELSRVIGDVAAHGLGEFARGVGQWAREARTTMAGNLREYLQEESGDVPSRDEVDAFASAVNALRDDVERLAARIERLGGGR